MYSASVGENKYLVFSFNLCVLFFQTATKLFGQIVSKLFGSKCLLKRSVGYFFWPRGAVQELLRH